MSNKKIVIIKSGKAPQPVTKSSIKAPKK